MAVVDTLEETLAVILAAGQGMRLRPLTNDRPKCLLKVGNHTLLEHQLTALQANGIRNVVIVTGYLAEQIHQAAAGQAQFVHNPDYMKTNNLHSLWCARELLHGHPFVVLHADLLFHPEILRQCLRSDGDVVLAVDRDFTGETMQVRLVNGRVSEIRKNIPSEQAFGTFIGLAVFSTHTGAKLIQAMAELIAENPQAYFTSAIEVLSASDLDVCCCVTDGLPWIEIDFPYELDKACREVLPAILDLSEAQS